MSSVFGLKARPQTAKVLPDRSLPKRASMRSRRSRFCRSFTVSTPSRMEVSTSCSRRVRISAFTSLGKQEPP
jgi:hypothetical protein